MMRVSPRMRCIVLGLGWALASGPAAPAFPADDPAPAAQRIFHKARSFRIPFNIDSSERARLREVELWCSSDRGGSWNMVEQAAPDRGSFSFQAKNDGEFWFAVRTQDTRGRLFPADNRDVEPKLKVVVDTTPPVLVVTSKGRRGSQVVLHYEARDENIDLTKLHLEYQVDGATTWRRIAQRRPALSTGDVAFDAFTADTLRVRGSVVDRAGNGKIHELTVSEGLPDETELASDEQSAEAPAPPPITPIVRNTGRNPDRSRPAPAPPPPTNSDEPPPLDELTAGPGGPGSASVEPEAGVPLAGDAPRLLVGSSRFPLKYAVDNAGPGGPATVEMWITRDDGRTWSYLAQDPDRASPFQVELAGDGIYGLRIVARSASGMGDRPPQVGDLPEIYVEVDTTPPTVRMGPAQLLSGAGDPAVRITWKADDPHLGSKPVVISYRPDRPDGIWQQITPPLPNNGQYTWKLPPNIPGRVHFRIDVIDTLDNRGWAETPDGSPVVVDRSRPKGKILGLDQGASGSGAKTRY